MQHAPDRQRIPALTYYGVIFATILCWMTYSGPYKWLAEWQLHAWGKYYPTLNILILSASFYGIAYWARRLWQLRHPTANAKSDTIDRYLQRQQEKKAANEPVTRLAKSGVPRSLGCLLWFGVLGIILSVGSFVKVWMAGELTVITVSELENGQRLESGWIEVIGGKLLEEETLSLMESRSGSNASEDFYVPLVSEQWQPGNPVSMYVCVRGRDRLSDLMSKESIHGMTVFSQLPGEIRTALEKSPCPPAGHYYVLNAGESPVATTTAGWFFLKCGGVLLGIFGLCFLVWRCWPVKS